MAQPSGLQPLLQWAAALDTAGLANALRLTPEEPDAGPLSAGGSAKGTEALTLSFVRDGQEQLTGVDTMLAQTPVRTRSAATLSLPATEAWTICSARVAGSRGSPRRVWAGPSLRGAAFCALVPRCR
jgi:hypothetical protein